MRRTLIVGVVAVFVCTLESRALAEDAKAECVEANTKAQDLRRTGKLSAAREQLRRCADSSCPAVVSEDCTRRLDEINQSQPTVAFEVKDAAGNDVPGVKISVDGRPLATSAPGIAFDVDPGEHAFTFDAPGFPQTQTNLTVVEAVKGRHEVVVMGSPSSAKGAPGVPAGARSSSPPLLTWVAFGVGAAGLALGIGAGVVAGSKHNALVGGCPENVCPSAENGDLDAFRTLRTVSTIGYVIGALGLAGGATLWLIAPRKSGGASAGFWLGPASGSASIRGQF